MRRLVTDMIALAEGRPLRDGQGVSRTLEAKTAEVWEKLRAIASLWHPAEDKSLEDHSAGETACSRRSAFLPETMSCRRSR